MARGGMELDGLLHLWVIALFVALVLRDSLDEPLLGGWLSDGWVAAVTLAGMAMAGGVTHAVAARSTAILRRRGSWRAVVIGESALGAGRWAAVALHVFAILGLGWLDVVRRAIGDVIVVDELIALTPALLVFAWGWWAAWPMERALREATTIRDLDLGVTVYPMPRRGAFTLVSMRHHVLVWLTPLFLILAWAETTQRVTLALAEAEWGGRMGSWFAGLRDEGTRAMVNGGLELVGVAVVFLVLGPLAMRFVWDTARLERGPLRDRLRGMCARHGVRVSDVLVWRTHGTMINGAVLGLTPAFRYVLLTDALLDSLPDEEVEAVMAHEVGHVRHRHIVWLAVVIAVTVTAAAWAAELGLGALGWGVADETVPEWLALGIAGGSFAAAMMMFGVVSRRFEWQADAFAAAHMSERLNMLEGEGERGAAGTGTATSAVVTHGGAGAMAAALRSVARLNHVALERSSWRHGSIGSRVDRLAALIGTPVRRAPIDRTSRTIKRIALAAAGCLAGAIALQLLLGA